MAQKKRKTPSKKPNKSAELEVEEEVAAVAKEQVPEEAELNKNADPNDAEADQKNLPTAEANERNTEKIDIQETISEKPVSKKKTRKRNAEISVDEPTNVEKVAAQPKVDEIVALEPKKEEIGGAKQINEEDVKAEQSSAKKSAKKTKSKQNVTTDGDTAEKVDLLQLKISAPEYTTSGAVVGEIGKINTEKSEVGQINTEKVDAEQRDGIIRRQMKKLRRRQGSEEKISKENNTLVVVEGEIDKKAESEQKNEEKAGAKKKIEEQIGTVKKIVLAIEGEVAKKVESEKKNTLKVDSQQRKLNRLERLKRLEKEQREQINPVKLDDQHNNGLSRGEKMKLIKPEHLNNKTAEDKRKSIGQEETDQKKPEEMDIDGTVQEKLEKTDVNEQDEAKKRKLENIEKQGVLEEEPEEENNKKPKTNDDTYAYTYAIEMLVDRLSRDEISEILKSAVRKNGDLPSLIEEVADRDPSRRKICVKNLSSDTKSVMLYKVFSQYGKLIKCEAVMDRDTGKCKGYGMVTFKSVSSVVSALTEPRKKINGQWARCKLAWNESSINPCVEMLGPGGFVNPAMLGPGQFVNPSMLGPGGFVSPAMIRSGASQAMYGPGVRSNMLGNPDSQAVWGKFGPPNYH